MARSYIRAHEPMLIEWITKTYPPGSWRTNVRLGKPTPQLEQYALLERERRMLQLVLHCADAVVILPTEVHIIEVATEPKTHKICQLKLYGHLFGTTEAYREYWHLPRVLIVLSTISNELIQGFSRREGVRWIVYVPIWWEDHKAIRQARKFTAPAVEVPDSLKEEPD